MLFARHTRLAAIGTALLLSLLAGQAQATTTFQFTSCVSNCISSSGCEPDSAKCMCKRAQDILLDSVVSCLFFNCKTDLRDFAPDFLEPIAQGCEDSHRDIPRSKLRAASSLASSYISKIVTPTTSKAAPTTTTNPAPTTTPTTTKAPATTKHATSSSSSSTDDDGDDGSQSSTSTQADDSTSAAPPTTTAQTKVVAPTSATTTSSRGPASDSESGFDTNPFGSSGGSAGSAVRPLLSLLGLPLAVVVGLLAVR